MMGLRADRVSFSLTCRGQPVGLRTLGGSECSSYRDIVNVANSRPLSKASTLRFFVVDSHSSASLRWARSGGSNQTVGTTQAQTTLCHPTDGRKFPVRHESAKE